MSKTFTLTANEQELMDLIQAQESIACTAKVLADNATWTMGPARRLDLEKAQARLQELRALASSTREELSENAKRMDIAPPTAELRAVSGPQKKPNVDAKWREMNAGRSLERDAISPGTRAAR